MTGASVETAAVKPDSGIEDLDKLDIRVGTIVAVTSVEASNKLMKLTVDFGADIGVRRCSAQLTELYEQDALLGRQVVAVVNFPRKQIGPFMSDCLVTGFYRDDGAVVLAVPDQPVPNGAKLG